MPGTAEYPRKPVASAIHTLGLLVFLGIWAYLGRVQATQMRAEAVPNHLQLYLPIFISEWLLFGYVVYGIRRRGVTLRELVGPRWSSPAKFFLDLAIAIGFIAISLIILGLVGHLIRVEPSLDAVRFMAPIGVSQMVMWLLLSLTAGICEETIFRGYLQRQFTDWMNSAVAGVVISGAIFGACHIYQGGKHAILIAVFGMLFGTLTVLRRSLRPGMIAHALQDSVAGLAISYAISHKLGGM